MRILIFIAAVPAAVILYFFMMRALTFWAPDAKKPILRIISAACGVAVALLCVFTSKMTSIVVLQLIIAMLLVEAVNAVFLLVGRLTGKSAAWWTKARRSGILTVVLAVCLLGYGYINMMHVVPTDYAVTAEKSIRPEGYRIIMLSDLHAGTTLSAERLQSCCDEISAAEPDILVLCGDIVDESTGSAMMRSAFAAFGSVNTKFGIYCVYGNHDTTPYTQSPDFTTDELNKVIEDNGIHILNDSTAVVNGELLLAGRADIHLNGDGSRLSAEALYGAKSSSLYTVVLDHQPTGFAENIAAGADLQLSGHTHAGQIWPLGVIYPLLRAADYTYGEYTSGSFTAIVSSGIAGWGFPIRTERRSEYDIIDISKK